jgi:hypothetical protein
MRRFFLVAAIASALFVAGAAQLPAVERTSAPAPTAFVETDSVSHLPTTDLFSTPLLAQYSNDNGYSGSSRVRIPIKLIVGLVMGVIAIGGWVLKRVFA